MRKFEAPYNFDKKLPKYAEIYKENIEFFYLPCFQKHGKDTRGHYYVNDVYPQTEEEYISHLENMYKYGFNAAVLMQTKITDEDIIKFYINNGVKYFIVGYDETAEIIKKIDKSLCVIASITQVLNIPEIENKSEALYDRIVLYFPFNRALKLLKTLPKKFKYVLMPNSGCSVDCNAKNHWFKQIGDKPTLCRKSTASTMFVPPPLLSLFDEYIDFYKLDGRPSTTNEILNFMDLFVKAPIYDLKNSKERAEFYNKYLNYIFDYTRETNILKYDTTNADLLYKLNNAPDIDKSEPFYRTFEEREANALEYKINLQKNPNNSPNYVVAENIIQHFNSAKNKTWFYDNKFD